MKAKIHPVYFTNTAVTCACGNKFTTGSTKEFISVEVCNKCHPFYTGEHRFVDVRGKVERFKTKQKMALELQKKFGNKKDKKLGKGEKQTKSLRELLTEG